MRRHVCKVSMGPSILSRSTFQRVSGIVQGSAERDQAGILKVSFGLGDQSLSRRILAIFGGSYRMPQQFQGVGIACSRKSGSVAERALKSSASSTGNRPERDRSTGGSRLTRGRNWGIKARHRNRNAVLNEGFRKNSPSVGHGSPSALLEQCEALVKQGETRRRGFINYPSKANWREKAESKPRIIRPRRTVARRNAHFEISDQL